MATEKLEKLTTDQLKKKEKEENIVIIAFPIIFLVCVIGLIIIKPDLTGATIPILAPAWISFRSRKKIREELKKRESKA
jgi:cell division protein FtsW (lipid II flippase)